VSIDNGKAGEPTCARLLGPLLQLVSSSLIERAYLSFRQYQNALTVGACSLVMLALVARIAPRLPLEAALSGDSESYITQASFRPPLYGWVLAIYHWATGSYAYLPLLQFLLIALGLLVFSVNLGRLLKSIWVGPLAILLVVLHVYVHEALRQILSESLYLAAILAGLGLQFRYARRSARGDLVGAAICFASAAATRSTGVAFLLLPVLTAVLDGRHRFWTAASRSAQAALAGAAVLIMAMAGNYAKHGHFEIGSWTGMAILGKGLLVLDSSGLPTLPPFVAAIAPEAVRLRDLISAQPNIADRMRAQMQASEDLRFALFAPAAEATWPEWQGADWRARGHLAMKVGQDIIRHHPLDFLKVGARDWGSLLLYPMHWPAWASSERADRLQFPACRLHDNCWALTRYDIPAPALVAMLTVSIGGAIGGAILLLTASIRALRRKATPTVILFWSMALVLHASLLASGAFESGLVRYTIALHALGVGLLVWFLHLGWRRMRARFPLMPFISGRRPLAAARTLNT
jgi:hypothetical protein